MSDAFDRAAERESKARRIRRTRPIWRGFLIHLRVYLIVNAALFAIWLAIALIAGDKHPWFLHSLAGWGIGLFVHYVCVTQITKQWWPAKNSTPSYSAGQH
jgi:2TM domain-containing protein